MLPGGQEGETIMVLGRDKGSEKINFTGKAGMYFSQKLLKSNIKTAQRPANFWRMKDGN